ncbi:hypothetical protein Misp01_55140 [Microtetraspora sp. NBRC 13810]|nr:hypothetical protein Misp01_55140 [Microtetraspora sp. NBRC 13810]
MKTSAPVAVTAAEDVAPTAEWESLFMFEPVAEDGLAHPMDQHAHCLNCQACW